MKISYYFFTAVLIAISINTGCDSNKPSPVVNETKTEAGNSELADAVPIPECGSYAGDTINLHGKFVLFFGPVAENGANTELPAGIKEFQTFSSNILDSLHNQPGLFSVYTSANYIRIYPLSNGKPMIIMRNSFKEPTGIIVSDGLQAPMIKKGNIPEAEYRALINQYFIRPS